MEVRQLNTLIRAAQFQSFSKAAESLGYSQSAVTVQIKALEEELGVRLFDRMGKRVILTAQGQCFLEYANSILDTIHNARRALREDAELEGCLHIGTLESLCFFRLPGLMHQFRVEHPKVSLRVTTGSPEELIEKMERGEVDLICILDEPRYSNSWHKCNEIPEEVVFVASPDIDLGHHMNNVAYVRLLLDCFSAKELASGNIQSVELHYSTPCFEGEALTVYKKSLDDGTCRIGIVKPDGKTASQACVTFCK